MFKLLKKRKENYDSYEHEPTKLLNILINKINEARNKIYLKKK